MKRLCRDLPAWTDAVEALRGGRESGGIPEGRNRCLGRGWLAGTGEIRALILSITSLSPPLHAPHPPTHCSPTLSQVPRCNRREFPLHSHPQRDVSPVLGPAAPGGASDPLIVPGAAAALSARGPHGAHGSLLSADAGLCPTPSGFVFPLFWREENITKAVPHQCMECFGTVAILNGSLAPGETFEYSPPRKLEAGQNLCKQIRAPSVSVGSPHCILDRLDDGMQRLDFI